MQAPAGGNAENEPLVSYDSVSGVSSGTLLREQIESEFISDRPIEI